MTLLAACMQGRDRVISICLYMESMFDLEAVFVEAKGVTKRTWLDELTFQWLRVLNY